MGESVERAAVGPIAILEDLEAWALWAARRVTARLDAALRDSARASLVLPGGGTPVPLLHALARGAGAALEAPLDWERVDVYLGDERCVAPEHSASNAGLVVRELLERFRGARPRFHPIEGAQFDAQAAAERYERGLPARIDMLVAGIGADGHTASLFPGHAALLEDERRVIAVRDCPKPPPDRITLTVRVQREARECLTLVRGASKASAVARAIEGRWDPLACPAQLLRRGGWALDEAAAAELTCLERLREEPEPRT